jgi:putative addiction module component (TIGR02574 family)
MSEATAQLLEAVQALPEVEQRELAEAITDQLDEPDDALYAEMERRRSDYEAGRTRGIDGEEFFRMLREKN